jgi:hypothetical protein
MNPYAMLGSGIGANEATALAARLSAWHDAMVAHERRLRAGRTDDLCDDECPHAEARTLWPEAVEAFGTLATELTFLRTRATGARVSEREPSPDALRDRRVAAGPELRMASQAAAPASR